MRSISWQWTFSFLTWLMIYRNHIRTQISTYKCCNGLSILCYVFTEYHILHIYFLRIICGWWKTLIRFQERNSERRKCKSELLHHKSLQMQTKSFREGSFSLPISLARSFSYMPHSQYYSVVSVYLSYCELHTQKVLYVHVYINMCVCVIYKLLAPPCVTW